MQKSIDEVFEGQFMQPEITAKQTWYQVEDKWGETFLYPGDLFSKEEVAAEHEEAEVEELEGFGARLSASGYLDCTDWCVLDTEEEAEQYLIDTYGDDE